MGTRWKLYSLAGGALAAEIVAYLLWRPRMLRWGATAEEASEPLPGDDHTPHPRVQSTRAVTIDVPPEQVWPWLLQMGIGRAGFYTHDWVERLIVHARYVEGKHSATRIHSEIPPLQAGGTVPMGAGAFAPVSEVEPYRHLVAQETYVLRALAGNKTRLIARYRGMGFVSPAARAIRPDAGRLPRLLRSAVLHVPGIDLALRGFDLFVSDLLHHYMETGMLTGIKARAEGRYSHVFVGNGFRCPLTELAERYGAEQGSVTDIYLPKWFAHNMPAIHTPLLVLMIYLHARNLRRPR